MELFFIPKGLIAVTIGGNRMKKGIIALSVLALVAITASSVFARGRGEGCGMGGGQGFGGSYMQQELGLTDAQQDKIFKISQEYRQKFYDNRKDYVKVAELRAEKVKAIDAVLTKEQKEKFANLHKDGPSKGKGPRR
jgi:Spy/CpxP family protein refolding chaperone